MLQWGNNSKSLQRLQSKLEKFRENRFLALCRIHIWFRKIPEMEKVGGWDNIGENKAIPH